MRTNDIIAGRDECLIWAFSALDLRLAANSSDPLVPAHGRIARLPRLRVFPSPREHILAPTKQAPKQRDLRRSRRGHRDASSCRQPPFGLLLPRPIEYPQSIGDLGPLLVERNQPAPQGRSLPINVVRGGDRTCLSDVWAVRRRLAPSGPCPPPAPGTVAEKHLDNIPPPSSLYDGLAGEHYPAPAPADRSTDHPQETPSRFARSHQPSRRHERHYITVGGCGAVARTRNHLYRTRLNAPFRP